MFITINGYKIKKSDSVNSLLEINGEKIYSTTLENFISNLYDKECCICQNDFIKSAYRLTSIHFWSEKPHWVENVNLICNSCYIKLKILLV